MRSAIQEFTLSLLTYKGALTEPEDGSAGVLLGRDLASALGMNEYEQLVFDPSMDLPGATRVDYDAPSFEAAGRLVDSMGRIACVTVPAPELRSIDPEEELERALRLQNGVFRVRNVTAAEQLYFCFFIQYDVMADESSGGFEELWVNPATHSMPRMSPMIDLPALRDAAPAPELGLFAARAWKLAVTNASSSIRSRIAGFLASLKRRRERDLQRIRDYYEGIDGEIRRKIERMASKPEAVNGEIQRLQATTRAYEARAAELLERYRVRVRIAGLAALACAIPAYQIHVRLLRRSAEAEAVFTWNPFDRKIEARCCDACSHVTGAAALCDDQVHYLCLDCLAACHICSKTFCRACHGRCPRSHRSPNQAMEAKNCGSDRVGNLART